MRLDTARSSARAHADARARGLRTSSSVRGPVWHRAVCPLYCMFRFPKAPPPVTEDDIAEANISTIFNGSPLLIAFFIGLVAVECRRSEGEWKPILYGGMTFVVAWALHLYCANGMKKLAGLEDVSADAFGSFTTLMGLVFSLQLGQTCKWPMSLFASLTGRWCGSVRVCVRVP